MIPNAFTEQMALKEQRKDLAAPWLQAKEANGHTRPAFSVSLCTYSRFYLFIGFISICVEFFQGPRFGLGGGTK